MWTEKKTLDLALPCATLVFLQLIKRPQETSDLL